MIRVSLLNDGALEASLKKLETVPGKIPRVMRSAIRRATGGGRKVANARIREIYTYKRTINKDMKSKVSGMSGEIVIRGKPHVVTSFKHKKPRRRRRGSYLRSEEKRGHVREHRRAFMRVELPLERVGSARLPIRSVPGPSSAAMAGHEPDVAPFILRRIEERLGVEVEHEVKAALGGFI